MLCARKVPSALVESLYSVHEYQKRVPEAKVDLEEEEFDILMLRHGTISHLGFGDSSVGGYFIHIVLKHQKNQKMPFLKDFEVYIV